MKLMSSLEATVHSTEDIHLAEEDVEQEAEDSEHEDGLIGQEYSRRLMSDLPERFSGLLDEHFPLFVTFDQVWVPLFLEHPTSLFCE